MKKALGFTLIELLLVIAIIAILAAMLLPALSQAQGENEQANCASNLKLISTAFYMYFSDYNDRFPPTRSSNYVTTCGHVAYYLQNYVPMTVKGEEGIWKCPNYPEARALLPVTTPTGGTGGIYDSYMMPSGVAVPTGGVWATYQMPMGWPPGYTHDVGDYRDGYGLATHCYTYTYPDGEVSPFPGTTAQLGATRRLAEIKNASAMCMLFESGANVYPFFSGSRYGLFDEDRGYKGNYDGTTSSYSGDAMCLGLMNPAYQPLHSDGNNYLFVDGHVEWRTKAQLTQDMWKVNY